MKCSGGSTVFSINNAKSTNLTPFLTPYTKTGFRYIINLIVIGETITFMEDNIRQQLQARQKFLQQNAENTNKRKYR